MDRKVIASGAGSGIMLAVPWLLPLAWPRMPQIVAQFALGLCLILAVFAVCLYFSDHPKKRKAPTPDELRRANEGMVRLALEMEKATPPPRNVYEWEKRQAALEHLRKMKAEDDTKNKRPLRPPPRGNDRA